MKKYASLIVLATLVVFLLLILVNINETQVTGSVLKVDNSEVIKSGVASVGYQSLIVRVSSGRFKNTEIPVENQLTGKREFDELYNSGDKIIVGLHIKNSKIKNAKAVSHNRIMPELLLVLLFVMALLVYAKKIGLKALLSFVLSLIVIWKVLVPLLLQGYSPLAITVLCLVILTFTIIFAVAGFTKTGLAAFLGTITGLVATIILTVYFGDLFQLHGLTAPYAETLIYNGYFHLNMKQIFYVAIIIGASGAAMDIAMDVAASMREIKTKKTNIKPKELIKSGFNIGKAVIGTMSTTLLLAYSGSYLPLLMLFLAQNSSYMRIFNMKIVAAEILRTLIGSIGLILVAPITAIFAGYLLCSEQVKIPNLLKMFTENYKNPPHDSYSITLIDDIEL